MRYNTVLTLIGIDYPIDDLIAPTRLPCFFPKNLGQSSATFMSTTCGSHQIGIDNSVDGYRVEGTTRV